MQILNFIDSNKSWIFDGIGVLLLTGLGWVIKQIFFKNINNKSQSQNGGNNSINIQVGQDFNMSNSKIDNKK